jgi:hypothetical protein
VIATGSRASVEHNLLAGESIQNLVNDFSIAQMFSPVWKHAFDNLFAIRFSHEAPRLLAANPAHCVDGSVQATPRSYNLRNAFFIPVSLGSPRA